MMTHQVFINFRGVDMRKTFVSHLLSSFKTKVITSCIASEPFEDLDHEAMENSLVAISLISKRDLTANWWIEDLSRMIECEKIGTLRVVPIFFQVSLLDILSRLSGTYVNMQNETLEMVRKWLHAQMSCKTSFHSDDWEDDSEMVDKITSCVSDILISSTSSYHSAWFGLSPSLELKSVWANLSLSLVSRSDPIFIREPINLPDVRSLSFLDIMFHEDVVWNLLLEEDSTIIGLCGMEGVGKTTLARALYEEISPRFPHRYSMNDFGGELFLSPLNSHQMFHSEDWKENSFHWSSDEAMREMMGNRKVLLVADGVDDFTQLKRIIKDASCFGPGSRVIVTTREMSLLTQCGVKHIYEVECPRYGDALAFFSQFAFKQSNPLPGYEDLSFRAVHVANRLPLALKVLGSFLHGKEKDEWVSTLRGLEASRDNYASEVNRYIGADDYALRRPMNVDRHIRVDEANSFPLYCFSLE